MFGRSSGGKTLFTRIAGAVDVRLRENDPQWPVHRQPHTVCASASGPIPLLIDDVTGTFWGQPEVQRYIGDNPISAVVFSQEHRLILAGDARGRFLRLSASQIGAFVD